MGYLVAQGEEDVDQYQNDKVFLGNLFMIFLVNMVYPVYWLIDPFYFLKLYQRYVAEKHFKHLEDERAQGIQTDAETGNKKLPPVESKDYTQPQLNE